MWYIYMGLDTVRKKGLFGGEYRRKEYKLCFQPNDTLSSIPHSNFPFSFCQHFEDSFLPTCLSVGKG